MSHWSSEYVLTKSAKVIGAFCCAGWGLSTKTRDKRNIPKQCVWLMAISILISSAHVIADSTLHFNIPRQNADEALLQFGTQADISVVYDHNLIKDLRTNQLHGEFTLEQGIRILLKDSGLKAEFKSSSHLVVTRNYWGIDQMNSKKNLLAATVAFFMGSGAVSSVVAQGDDGAKPKGNYSIEEIVVTATKRGAGVSIQDTAMAISAIAGDTIERRGIVGMDDYLRTLPGVDFQDRGAGQNSVVIRGIASSPQTEDSSAGVYFGETPISDLGSSSGLGNAGNADIKLVDIERVEVLRGPQGTLYGSGSMSGTVRVIPTGPNLEQLEGKLATRYSQTGGDGDDNTMLQGALNVPVIEDKLAVRGVLYRFDNSGYITNVAESQPSSSITNAVSMGSKAEDRDDVGNETYKGVRLTALWKPTDNFDVTLGYIQQEIEQDGTPEINLDLEGDYQQRRVNTGPEGVSYESLENDIDISSLTLNYDFGWSSITSSSSWVDYESAVETDFSHIFGPYYSDSTKVFDFFIQEVRLISQLDGRLQFVAGLYYEDKENEFKFLIPWSGDPALDTGPLQNVDTDRTIEQQAFFGELSYDLSDKLVATVGGRYFDYERTRVDTADVAGIRRFTNRETGTEETGQTYKANLTYNPNDDMLVYAQWAEGFRLGKGQAENIRCTDLGIETPSSVDSDTSENFEIGFKSSLVDNSVMFNAAIYRINWDDIPIKVQPEGRCSYDDNAGTAKSEGIEIELLARLTESFQLDLSASYGEATLTEDAPAVGGSKGDDLPGSADYNVNLGLEYNFILAGYDSFSRIDYAYLGEYHNSFNSEGQAAGGFGQINFKVGVEIDKVALDLFVNNLADDDGLTWVESTNFNLSGVSRAYRIRPRTVGLNLSYSF